MLDINAVRIGRLHGITKQGVALADVNRSGLLAFKFEHRP